MHYQLFSAAAEPIGSLGTILTTDSGFIPYVYNGAFVTKLTLNRFLISWLEGHESSGIESYNIISNLYEFDNTADSLTLINEKSAINQSALDYHYSMGSLQFSSTQTLLLWGEKDYIYGRFIDSQGTLLGSQIKLVRTNAPLGITGVKIQDNVLFLTWTQDSTPDMDVVGDIIYLVQ